MTKVGTPPPPNWVDHIATYATLAVPPLLLAFFGYQFGGPSGSFTGAALGVVGEGTIAYRVQDFVTNFFQGPIFAEDHDQRVF
ncbi:MAG: hypothetical protein SP1CHLAM54_12670 [Chlamydiia bacterium]|nr:hypothetical protein [Chlamydiia bacterium]MCH9616164.1 hypothetical protein [Chlamydiia bacterium]MCH9629850.1 hypothetical protein [Chlamydiia bacterium]